VSPPELQFVDEHAQPIAAPAGAVWTALVDFIRRRRRRGGTLARLLGCEPAGPTPEFAARPGETIPGFRVVAAEPERRLALAGRHRFAAYTLTFHLDGRALRATTHAAFPGIAGTLYRAAVIGSGAHRLITRGMLRRIANEAELR
jgi:hypothetical protein